MPETRNQLRRRRKQAQSATSSQTRQTPQQHETSTQEPSALKLNLLIACRFVYFALMGLLCAASITETVAAVILFGGTVAAMFLILLLVFMSVLRTQDQTPVQLPTVHLKDGTVRRPEPMTVHKHDYEVASYFAKEFPALAAAAAWFYLWASIRPVFLCYTLYLAYRIGYHPLFRIHLWKEPDCPEFERPFGGVPLFKPDDSSSAVKVVEGRDAYTKLLTDAADKLVIVDFSAAWCGPCRAMAPVFKQMAEESGSQHVFATVDVTVSQDVAEDENIVNIPTFILFRNKERVEMIKGSNPKALKQAIERHS